MGSKQGFFFWILPSQVDGYNVLIVVCLGGVFVFKLMIPIGYKSFIWF
jgi:hypothetical protein